ncbi:MAG: transglycosylase domain-containing protein [Bacteroidia bacterium]|nr:transglycosylase domain-containing protein [Bacteroidia bacterium]
MSNLTRIKRIFITLAITAGVFLLLGIISFFALRNYLLTEAIVKISQKVKTKFNVTLSIKDAHFTGLTTVEFNNVSLKPANHDSILFAAKVTTSVKLRYAILGDIRLGELHVNDGYLNWVNDERGRNVSAFLNSKDSSNVTNDENVSDKNLAKTGYKLISKVLNFIPSDLQITNFDVKVTDFKHHIGVKINNLALINQQLNSNIAVSSFKDSIDSRLFTQNWQLSGTAIPSQKKADIQLTNNDTGKVLIPYIAERFGLIAGFDNIRFNLKGVDLSKNELVVTGLASTYNFLINHPKIAKKDVIIEKAELDYTFIIGSNFVSLDSTSTITFNKIKVHPFVKYQRGPDTTYQLNVVIEKTTAQDFIYSLPEGLFNHFKGMEAEGTFSYRLDFLYNENNPRDLVFESSLQKEGLRITKYGEANLSKLNSEFVYQAMENGRVQRNIDVSYNNPNFVPIDQISPLLKKAVLTTEDPSFFYHRGFIDEAFRQSIIKNIRKKGFVRGASTISMQLVKNVFLTREKTLSRKLEEILLVYILENNRLSSKERMFEVYLNIIEWGPNVYGIGEAARFYFNKSASDLTLSEAMYLAIIIPSPKKFMWRFGKDGALKDHVGRHFQTLAGLMIRRNVLMQEDTMGLTHHISITGPAKGFIKITADTLQNDSILFDENGVLIESDED